MALASCFAGAWHARFALQYVALLEHKTQLPDVARPVVLAEGTQRIFARLPNRLRVTVSELLGEVVDEQRNVGNAVPQRRHLQLDKVQPIVEIFAEAPLSDFLL